MLKKFNKNLSEVLNTFENIMENGAFAPKEQMLHFPQYFQIHGISKVSKVLLCSKGLIRACISDSHIFNVAVPFKGKTR